MSRSLKRSESEFGGEYEDLYDATPEPGQSRRGNLQAASSSPPSPSSVSSEKENRPTQTASGKRKRFGESELFSQGNGRRRTTQGTQDASYVADYDPDQDIDERRKLRKGLRDLSKNLTDNRGEYLNPNSTGLLDTLRKANDYSSKVKQTADATIDSRLLVTAADLSYRKTVALTSGDTAQGVDVDEFVSKCITYMRLATGAAEDAARVPSSTQRRRRGNHDDDDDGDMLNWEHLGRFACLPNNSRPSVPGFLLGPLSLEKRARKVTQRRAALRHGDMEETRPQELKMGDVERNENANLTTLCTKILMRLNKAQRDVQAAVEAEADDKDMTDEEITLLMDRYGTCPNGGISLFKFVVNPYSFGQTVENMFYVSFLIRDGKVGITYDDNGLPYLDATEPRDRSEMAEQGARKHQAVIELDMDEWEQIIENWGIEESMIPHREEDDNAAVRVKGWYA
ncbi:Nse4 C-terminal-domain-containing protein [Xylogone sp. PMI_703]|nr:Nse4 C-terminal-domain-containing protein [Xylogone sp. PMI_703]